jgi:hypothetical protein
MKRKMLDLLNGVPRRLFFAAPQRIAITLSPKYYQRCSIPQRERIKKNMSQKSSKFGEIIKNYSRCSAHFISIEGSSVRLGYSRNIPHSVLLVLVLGISCGFTTA